MTRANAGISSLLFTFLCASNLLAEPSAAEKETARSLMDQGDQFAAASSYAEALGRYRAAHEIMGVPTTGLELAKTEAQLGQLVEARNTALSVVRLPVAEGEPAVFTRARAEAEQIAEQLATRIPSLRIEVTPPGISPVVKIDGVAIPAAAIGLPYSMNPGAHRISVQAPGYADAAWDVRLSEGATESVTLALKPSAPPPPPAPPPAPIPAAEPLDASSSQSSNTGAYIALGVSAVGLGVGTVSGLMSLGAKKDAEEFCIGNTCSRKAADDINSSKDLATVANVSFAVGIVAGIYGIWSWASGSEVEEPGSAATGSWSVAVTPHGTSGGLVGVRGAL